jgi:hypothetical protein
VAESAGHEDSPTDESDAPQHDSAAASVAVLEEPSGLEVTAETIDAFWSQVLQQVPDTLANHLKNAQNLASSAPNVVEIRFPRSCLFSMNYCQREEPLGVLTRTAAKVAGKPVRIGFLADAGGPAAGPRSSPAASRRDDNRLRPKAVENDPFVQQAVQVFGGTVVDVRKVLSEQRTEATAETDDDGSEEAPAMVGEIDDE